MILTGLARLGRDAELRYTPDGTAVANLSLAFDYGRRDDDGKRPTQWIDAQLWGARAESLAPHLLKGTAFDVVLQDPHIETYQRNGGGEGHKLVARVVLIEFAGGQRQQQGGQQQQGTQPQAGGQQQRQGGQRQQGNGDAYRRAREGQPQRNAPDNGFSSGPGYGDMDDDIPFGPMHAARFAHAY